MLSPILAIAIFVVVFAIATLRNVHLGILMFPAACAVGVGLAGMPLRDVVGGFPVSIMVLLAGVTYFFGFAQANGTIDRIIDAVLTRAGARPVALPLLFFALTSAVASMGSPQAGLVLAPLGMPVARRSGVDPMLMAVAISSGISVGGYAPTSLFGIVGYRVAREAGIEISPLTLLAVAAASNLVLILAAFLLFGGSDRRDAAVTSSLVPLIATPAQPGPRFAQQHVATLVAMFGLVVSVIACALAGIEPDIGVLAFAFGAILTLIDPSFGAAAFARIDWSTVFVVGGIVTFVGVLQKLGAVDLLGRSAMEVGTPLLAAGVICMTAGLASAFASTTGILAGLVPLAVPLATSGAVSGWALISALCVCASIVDVSPFSTTGATLVASAPAEERARVRALAMWWGMSMVVVGPLAFVAVLRSLGGL
jgi:di/tricarboxylate transporter